MGECGFCVCACVRERERKERRVISEKRNLDTSKGEVRKKGQ